MLMERWKEKGEQILLCIALLAIVGVACALPIESSVAMLVGLFLFCLGVVGLSFVRDKRDRSLLVRLFVAAFGIRLLFTILAYGLDLISVIGGADDTGWEFGWYMSRFWRGYIPAPPNPRGIPGLRPPESFLELFSGVYGRNIGWHYYIANYLYLIDTHSQISVAFVNTFLSSLTPCVIYRATREYFSEKAALLAAGSAVIFPGFIAWSALTLKEPWLIFMEIFVFYLTWTSIRDRRWWALAIALFLIVVTYTMRFYIAYVMVAAIPFIVLGTRSKRPQKAAGVALVASIVAYIVGTRAGFIQIDVVGIVMENMSNLSTFREATSGGGSKSGSNTGVQLPYDPTTPQGVVQLVLVGGAYLLLSPFPWALSGKQLLTLPDVAIWWALVFGFIMPGLPYAWKKYPGLSIAILSYLLPLVLVYSFSFGNIGLAYRQRAQLMPFFLFFAAAGYDARRKKKEALEDKKNPSVEEVLERLRQAAQEAPSTQAAPNAPPVHAARR